VRKLPEVSEITNQIAAILNTKYALTSYSAHVEKRVFRIKTISLEETISYPFELPGLNDSNFEILVRIENYHQSKGSGEESSGRVLTISFRIIRGFNHLLVICSDPYFHHIGRIQRWVVKGSAEAFLFRNIVKNNLDPPISYSFFSSQYDPFSCYEYWGSQTAARKRRVVLRDLEWQGRISNLKTDL
jgi:hypothetical protein